MKAFIDHWLAEAAPFLGKELGLSVRFEAGGALPSVDSCINFIVHFSTPEQRTLFISVDATALAALLVETQVTDAQPDIERDGSLWREMLRESLMAAAKSFDGHTDFVGPLELASTKELDPLASSFVMHCGERAIQIALADHVIPRAPAAPVNLPSPAARVGANDSTDVGGRGIELLLDVELEASLRFGSCEMPLKEILELGPGDVVQLDRHVSDPVDLIVGDKIVARGEVVLVNGNFGLRILEVAEPRRCLESIRCLF